MPGESEDMAQKATRLFKRATILKTAPKKEEFTKTVAQAQLESTSRYLAKKARTLCDHASEEKDDTLLQAEERLTRHLEKQKLPADLRAKLETLRDELGFNRELAKLPPMQRASLDSGIRN